VAKKSSSQGEDARREVSDGNEDSIETRLSKIEQELRKQDLNYGKLNETVANNKANQDLLSNNLTKLLSAFGALVGPAKIVDLEGGEDNDLIGVLNTKFDAVRDILRDVADPARRAAPAGDAPAAEGGGPEADPARAAAAGAARAAAARTAAAGARVAAGADAAAGTAGGGRDVAPGPAPAHAATDGPPLARGDSAGGGAGVPSGAGRD
jgi:uncharacterized coiled-coil protein SlyX